MRSRVLQPSFFHNECLAQVCFKYRLLFAGLWTLADKEGRLQDRPAKIAAQLFPYDGDADDVDKGLDALMNVREPLIWRYESGGLKLIQVISWKAFGKAHHKEPESIFEPCLEEPWSKNDWSLPQAPRKRKRKSKSSLRKKRGQPKPDLDPLPGDLRPAAAEWFDWKSSKPHRYTDETGVAKQVSQLAKAASALGVGTVADGIERAIADGWKGWKSGIKANAEDSIGSSSNGAASSDWEPTFSETNDDAN